MNWGTKLCRCPIQMQSGKHLAGRLCDTSVLYAAGIMMSMRTGTSGRLGYIVNGASMG